MIVTIAICLHAIGGTINVGHLLYKSMKLKYRSKALNDNLIHEIDNTDEFWPWYKKFNLSIKTRYNWPLGYCDAAEIYLVYGILRISNISVAKYKDHISVESKQKNWRWGRYSALDLIPIEYPFLSLILYEFIIWPFRIMWWSCSMFAHYVKRKIFSKLFLSDVDRAKIACGVVDNDKESEK